MTTLVIWSDVWAMSGIGFGVVFVVLILLIFVMILLGKSVQKLESSGAKTKSAKPTAQPVAATSAAPAASASDADKAAIATALYLYFQNVHDEESDVITIKNNRHSAWHHELNNHFN
ncbi:MAG: OadG family protein [Bacteroidaceae bacterium]|nr:OadG family protein [Bacteroidaceae bacterium]